MSLTNTSWYDQALVAQHKSAAAPKGTTHPIEQYVAGPRDGFEAKDTAPILRSAPAPKV